MDSKPLSKLLIQIAPIIFFLSIMWGMSLSSPMWMDEYVFYRLASQFPEYSTTKDWLFVDRPTTLTRSVDWEEKGLDREKAFFLTYNTKIYPHTPLAVMLVYPVVKGLNYLADKEIIPHIEDEPGDTATTQAEIVNNRTELMTGILRIIPMALFGIALWLIFKLSKYKVGYGAYLFALPVAISVMMLPGNYLFYWDAFMMFFFVLTLYLMETRPNSKWKYITACALVNTKIFIGIWFTLPLIIKAIINDRRRGWLMCLPVLSILPFYIATVAVTGNPLYIFTHYLNQMPNHNFVYSLWTWPEGLWTVLTLGMPFYLIMTAPILYFWRKYPTYAVYWLVTMVYAWGTGLGITHTSSMVYAGALIFPLVANEWNLVDRLRAWLSTPEKTKVIGT